MPDQIANVSEHKSAARDASWKWLLALFTFGSLVETIFYGQLTAFTPLYLPKIGIQPEDVARWTGIIAAVAGLIGLPFLPFWGALADRFSRKPVIIRSFIVELLTALVALLAGNIWIFLVARAISSLSLGNSGLMMTTLSERAPAGRLALAFSIMNGAGPIGALLGPLAGGPIIDHYGFPTLMAIDAVLLGMVVIALAFGYRDWFRPSRTGSLGQMAVGTLRIILGDPRLRTLFAALFLLLAGWMLAFTYASLVIAQLYHGPDLGTRVGLILGAGGFVSLVLSPLMGALADRYGFWRILMVGVLVSILFWTLPFFTRILFLFGILWALINGLSTGILSLSFGLLARSTSSETRGRVMSMSYLPLNVGLVLGPTIGSLVARNNVFNIFPTAAILSSLGFLLLVLAHRQPATVESQP